jgi:glycosyltransferase involved in cell wall biosynthesis
LRDAQESPGVQERAWNLIGTAMHIPRVSVGLPVRNGEKYLRLALDSILRQDYTDFELIISDNASTDATQSICLEYAAKDQRIRYYRNETNIGASGNFNRVFELARGEFFKWIPHDDECHPAFLRRCIETFKDASADTVLVCSRSQVIDETGSLLEYSHLKMSPSTKPCNRLVSLMTSRCYPHPLWGLIRSEALRQTRLIGLAHADHILLAELALLGHFVELPEDLQKWRIHSHNALAVHRTSRQLLAWYDPSKANSRIVLPHRIACDLQYFRAVGHIPLSAKERLLCYGVVSWRMCVRLSRSCMLKIRLRSRLKKLLAKLIGHPHDLPAKMA